MNLYKYRRVFGILAVASIGIVSLGAVNESEHITEVEYIVQPGDTLWSVASNNINDDENILAYISEIKKANPHIKNDLQIGEKLIIKKYK